MLNGWRVGLPEYCPTEGEHMGSAYIDFVRMAGGEPVVLTATDNKDEIARLVDDCDTILFAGGVDIDPSRYGETPSPKIGKVNQRRDAWEFAILDAAVPRRKPLFGICRGCQVLNVYFGGTLWQDLPSEYEGCNPDGHHLKDEGLHEVFFEPDSAIAKRIGLLSRTGGPDEAGPSLSMLVNSTHHQAVKKLGRGFRVTARATDGVVEAIENTDYPAAAVQFHPERLVVKLGRLEFLPLVAR